MRLIIPLAFSCRMFLTPSIKQCSRNVLVQDHLIYGISRIPVRPLSVGLSDHNLDENSPTNQSNKDDVWHKVNRIRKIWKVETPQDVPFMPAALHGLPQIAVMGRSNSGKSSLINHLFGKGNYAKASSRAGKTKHVEVFSVNDKFALVDLPGFVSREAQFYREWKAQWEPLIRTYMNHFLPGDPQSDAITVDDKGTCLKGVLFVADVRWRATVEDQMMFCFIRDHLKLPLLLVLTKDDKLSMLPPSKKTSIFSPGEKMHFERNRFARLRRLEYHWKGPHVHYSIEERRGRAHLRRYIKSLIELDSQDQRHAMLDASWENIDANKIGTRKPATKGSEDVVSK